MAMTPAVKAADQTYNGTSTNAQSGTAIAGMLNSNFANIKMMSFVSNQISGSYVAGTRYDIPRSRTGLNVVPKAILVIEMGGNSSKDPSGALRYSATNPTDSLIYYAGSNNGSFFQFRAIIFY